MPCHKHKTVTAVYNRNFWNYFMRVEVEWTVKWDEKMHLLKRYWCYDLTSLIYTQQLLIKKQKLLL